MVQGWKSDYRLMRSTLRRIQVRTEMRIDLACIPLGRYTRLRGCTGSAQRTSNGSRGTNGALPLMWGTGGFLGHTRIDLLQTR